MRVNERIAISTSKVLLVPYEAHHVVRYHGWMQDPDIQEATASEPLTLDEEFENQQSWRTSHDKLTFILCEPLALSPLLSDTHSSNSVDAVKATVCDAAPRTKGDVNFFLYPDDDDDDDDDDESLIPIEDEDQGREMLLRGEVDVMVAEKDARLKGMGSASVRALIAFVRRHIRDILNEYARGTRLSHNAHNNNNSQKDKDVATYRLTSLMAKIKQDNVGSRALFERLGFQQRGEVDYFGEVKMVLGWDAVEKGGRWDEELEYHEVEYKE